MRTGDYVRMPTPSGPWYGYVQEIRGKTALVRPRRGAPWRVHVDRLHVASDPTKRRNLANTAV